jgi:hypothetical protein
MGAGTQNYTCASEGAVPVPVGAKATLFDASCLAASFPDLLHALPALVIELESPQIDFSLTLLSLFKNSVQLVQGHHFFEDTTTPVFDFQTNGRGLLAISKKIEDVPAPKDSPQGQFGAVDWLRLRTIEGTQGDIKDVYRVVTAGGAAPKSCKGRNGQFEIKYAAEYCTFSSPLLSLITYDGMLTLINRVLRLSPHMHIYIYICVCVRVCVNTDTYVHVPSVILGDRGAFFRRSLVN